MKEGQYKIGDMVFGAGTQCRVTAFEPVGYGIMPGDYAIPQSDEIRFRKDHLQPGIINMTVSVLDNYVLENMYDGGPTPDFASGASLVEQFMTEWRADEMRKIWGYTKPLTYTKLGRTRRVYGRPRDIAAPPRRLNPGWYDMVCAYQRADTLSYSEEIYGVVDIPPTTLGVAGASLAREDGPAPTWFDMFITGPINNPKVKVGPHTIDIAYNLPSGQIIQISSYPWDRRAVSSSGFNVAPKMIGDSPYLDELKFPGGATYSASLHGTGSSSATSLAVTWREAYHSL